jgi:uncharacterized hydrophobic protein (TIGR00271 family)
MGPIESPVMDLDVPLHTSLLAEATLSRSYAFLVIAACLLASLGLLANSTAVVIGAMIVAPLMLPIRALAWGALQADLLIFRRGLAALAVGVALSIALSWFVGWAVGIHTSNSEILARTQPNLLDLGVAIVAGAVSAAAKLRPRIGDAVAGTAIAVALMPPLCVTGLSAANGNSGLAAGAFLLFATNLLGIAFACMSVFAAKGHAPHAERTRRALAAGALLLLALAWPLTRSMFQLLDQDRVTAVIQRQLTQRTVTVGQQMELVSTRIDWSRTLPEVRLLVRAHEKPSSHQVELLETFLRGQLGRPVRLLFEVIRIDEVHGSTALIGPWHAPKRLPRAGDPS